MDPNRLKEAYQNLESLEDRLAYKLRPRSGMSSPSTDQLDQRMKDLATFTLDLKDIMKEFMLAFAKQG
jgi:hypothetical protein